MFQRNLESKAKITVNEGGTRSSKTYSILQLFLCMMFNWADQPLVFSVVRKTMPAMRSSAMKDFFDIIRDLQIYDESCHNASENIYRIGRAEIEFFSVDDAKKMRGRKRDYLFINEANELTREDFFQLNIRTTGRIWMDYNPSEIDHWIYSDIIPRPDCTLIKSTYLDNPFLPEALVQEIERIREQDEVYWKIYGLGERAAHGNTIYTNWDLCDALMGEEEFYGLDFGYNDPSALVRVRMHDGELYEEELIYERRLTNSDLIERMKALIPDRSKLIYCDGAEPDRIEEIRQAGFNAMPADKGKESVRNSIDTVKRYKTHIVRNSVNLIKEKRNWKWREDKNGTVLDEPVGINDHLMAAERYAVHTHLRHVQFAVLFEA